MSRDTSRLPRDDRDVVYEKEVLIIPSNLSFNSEGHPSHYFAARRFSTYQLHNFSLILTRVL